MQVFVSLENVKFEGEFAEFELLRVGKFSHALFGDFNMTADKLDHAVSNFEAGIPDKSIPVNFSHERKTTEAAGWFGVGEEGTKLERAGERLNIRFKPIADTVKKIRDEQFKFASAEFTDDFKDAEGNSHGFTIFGMALTNTPFLKGQEPGRVIRLEDGKYGIYDNNENKDNEIMKLEEIQNKLGVDSVDEIEGAIEKLQNVEPVKEVVKLEAENTELTDKVNGLEASITLLTEQIQSATKFQSDLKVRERDNKLAQLVNDGRILASDVDHAVKMFEASQEAYGVWLENVEAGEARFKGLIEKQGSDGDGKAEPVGAVAKLESRIKEIQGEDKCTYSEAFAKVKLSDPELVNAYNEATI